MAETKRVRLQLRHRGRIEQVGIYFGKLLRMFVYQNDWKVLPMAALIAGLVGMVTRRRFFISMEGTLMGAFAMTCVAIWNGCFNSIQVVCRERSIVKREHRSGMHVSSYVVSHMLYQAVLCMLQTGVTMYVTKLVGVQYPTEGLFTRWFIVDIGISVFIISYASDMLSLWISCLAHTTTTAMTVMPFVLIFQLVFSGGMLSLPAWSKPITYFTISNYGLKVLASQADFNHRPMAEVWNTLEKMQDEEVGGTFTLGQVLNLLTDTKNPTVSELRDMTIGQVYTLGEIRTILNESESVQQLRERLRSTNLTWADGIQAFLTDDRFETLRDIKVGEMTLGEIARMMADSPELRDLLATRIDAETLYAELDQALDETRQVEVGGPVKLGEIIDFLASNPDVVRNTDKTFTLRTTLENVMNLAGKESIRDFVQSRAAEASYKPEYENSRANIMGYWGRLILFVFAFSALAALTLEFIDKDKR